MRRQARGRGRPAPSRTRRRGGRGSSRSAAARPAGPAPASRRASRRTSARRAAPRAEPERTRTRARDRERDRRAPAPARSGDRAARTPGSRAARSPRAAAARAARAGSVFSRGSARDTRTSARTRPSLLTIVQQDEYPLIDRRLPRTVRPAVLERAHRPAVTIAAMTSPAILRYTAFTDTPEGGNPAGVVLDASTLSDERDAADRGRRRLLASPRSSTHARGRRLRRPLLQPRG